MSMNSSDEGSGSEDVNLFSPNSGQEMPEDEDAVLPIPENVSFQWTAYLVMIMASQHLIILNHAMSDRLLSFVCIHSARKTAHTQNKDHFALCLTMENVTVVDVNGESKNVH